MTPVDRTAAIPELIKSNQAGRANVPGLRRLWLIEARHVLGVTDPRTQPGNLTGWTLRPGGLQLAEDAQIIALTCRATMATHNQRTLTSPQGIAYGQALTLTLPKDDSQNALFIHRIVGRQWVIVYQDANGVNKLVGTPQQPLRADTAFGTNPSSHNLAWTATTRTPYYFFDEMDLLTTTEAQFSFGFSTDFFA